MKPTTLLIIVLAAALLLLCGKMALSGGKSVSAEALQDSIVSSIMTRTSIRQYADQPVENDKIETLLRAGMAAPTAVNKQPWHFVVVNDKATLQAIGGQTASAPLAIIVCGDTTKALPGLAQAFWVQDASAAAENILLAAHAIGLGAVWTGVYPDPDRCQKLIDVLHLPDNIIPMANLLVGYPAENPAPKDKWNPANVSYNAFGGTLGDAPLQPAVEQPKDFAEFDVQREFRQNPFQFFKGDGLLLAAADPDNKADFNEMTIGWGALGNIWRQDAVVTVYVAEGRHTFNYMEKATHFTVMAFDKDHKDILQYMGSHSGRDENKAEKFGLHTRYTDNGAPYFDEATMVLECEIMYRAPFQTEGMGQVPSELYADFPAGVHHMYMGKVVKALKK